MGSRKLFPTVDNYTIMDVKIDQFFQNVKFAKISYLCPSDTAVDESYDLLTCDLVDTLYGMCASIVQTVSLLIQIFCSVRYYICFFSLRDIPTRSAHSSVLHSSSFFSISL